ncbi:hypothetical protein EDC04DRAFT_3145096 [Pisolithus marmoratus]|nr:hypothetical protein EDC04DRAFT_3145096 [Pisolithus marmoratus]
MYIRTSALLVPVYALASLAAAAPGGIEARASCTSGTQLCCAQPYTAIQTGVAAIKALLGFTVNPVIGPPPPCGLCVRGSLVLCTAQDGLPAKQPGQQSCLRWLQQHRFVV